MLRRVHRLGTRVYERVLERELSEGPTHVAVIQDGNRRYARSRGEAASDGHRAGAETTEAMLNWCADLGVEELTLYAFSTENFDRPEAEREELFDLLADKLRSFADREEVHEREVGVRAIGEVERLPERVREAIDYAERRTRGYDRFTLNLAVAYGGRAELLSAARDVARAVEAGELRPEDVDTAAVERRLYEGPARDVDLIIRTGGDERTSNFLPWHANGNEAAVYFCSPYWPEFRRVDFMRAIRTYQHRQESWRRSRAERAAALVRAFGDVELAEARRVLSRFREHLPSGELEDVEADRSEPAEADSAESTEPADRAEPEPAD